MNWRVAVHTAYRDELEAEERYQTLELEAESFAQLILDIKETTLDTVMWHLIIPADTNPPLLIDEYATILRQDMPGNPWGDDRQAQDYFKVVVEGKWLWLRCTAHDMMEDPE